jgi:hypothetical protein
MNKPTNSKANVIILLLGFITLLFVLYTFNNEVKEPQNVIYYYEIDEVDDDITCILLVNGLGDEILYLDTRFGYYPDHVQSAFRAIIETQPGVNDLYDASLKYNELIDDLLTRDRLRTLKY